MMKSGGLNTCDLRFMDEEIRHYLKIPNKITLDALSENKKDMPVFNTMDELREDLLK
ncbi:hypothetical protein EPICR_10416 [Candidatus Desulfarcum epimagneticum]|uniref:Uncharacterized protein n=1 Tax=uncultured Desulfobacteraceae bacterium TaxID=218296 RepID=A0A484HI93_9BACT|nr:hypothetical protein EPICR_10416 [uncultured Desulfobacteraceae bacterium]